MKYYNSENGDSYYVATAGVSEKGTHYCVEMLEADSGVISTIISIESTVNKIDVETKLAEYAKENKLVPELIYKIMKGERVLQGTPADQNDFIAVTNEIIAKECERYFAAKSRIAELESDKKKEIEAVKDKFNEKIEAEQETMYSIESIVRSGTKKEECQASWERDPQNGVMLLIRHDTLKVLQWRKMTEAELQLCTSDDGAVPE